MDFLKMTIASGKGGTGKTTVAVSMAYSLAAAGKAVALLDCDVEEPNDHLFVRPSVEENHEVKALKPVLDQERCTFCGRCVKACNFNALALMKTKLLIFPELCHACGVCTEICPVQALREEPFVIGTVRIGSAAESFPEAPFAFADGTLAVGESLAPAVVRAVKDLAIGHAERSGAPSSPETVILTDASPGTACPVVAAMNGSDVVLLVTEPTPFGLHDLKLAASLSLQMGIPTGVVINRSVQRDEMIEEYCREVGIPILGRIPFRRSYAEAYSTGAVLAREDPSLQGTIRQIFDRARELVGREVPPAPPVETWAATAPAEAAPSGRAPDHAAVIHDIGVISGKGGTGKTTVTASLAVLTRDKILADTDVDAADLHLVLHPAILETAPFSGGKAYRIDPEHCVACGLCEEKCHFQAISHEEVAGKTLYQIDPVACEACGMCRLVCPAAAVLAEDAVNGTTFISETPYGPMVHARLGIGEENSGKLVTEVRRRAAELAERSSARLVLADGPPGVGCPVIASITNLDRVLVVTEPTVSGVHDLERVLDLANHFGIPAWVVINKADLNPEQAGRIETIAAERGARVIGTLPFDDNVYEALMAGKTVVEFGDGPATEALRKISAVVLQELRGA
ncbi:MAG: P-loop NTPase [Spirochaetales bacterium]|nr:P-loop NTPase [Spirochaetales bacterium]